MPVLEDALRSEDLIRIRDILMSGDWSFLHLVQLANLDPMTDFRHCDLRNLDLRDVDLSGFDFTLADLRGCIINSGTRIDDTTNLEDALIDWVVEDKKPIVYAMKEIEAASTASDRRQALEKLVAEYQSPQHIAAYLRNLIRTTRSYDTFFDYADFFESTSASDIELLKARLKEFVLQSSRRRTYRYPSQVSPIKISGIMSRLEETNNDILSQIYVAVKEKAISKEQIQLDPNRYLVSMELTEILAAIESR